MEPTRAPITRRELAAMALGAVALALVMHWPLPANLGSAVPKDLGDPLAQAWQPAWGGHALATQPLDFFQSNQFWPLPDTLAFSDALIGYAPAGLVGDGPGAAIVRYNLLFLFSYALAFAGAYLLARELGLRPLPAAIAGAAFAYAPFRLAQDGHLHVISSGGIPLALALGVRGYRLGSAAWVLGGFAAATWQLSIGFSLGLPFAYLLALVGSIAAVAWVRTGRPAQPRRIVVATTAGALLFAGSAFVLSRPYERVAAEHPQASRTPDAVEAFSDSFRSLALAPAENEIWGGASAGLAAQTSNPHEKTLFPGLLIAGLALAGALGSALARRLRIALAAGVVGVTVLAFGFQAGDGFLWPYRIVYETLPGWEGIRTPGRLATFSTLGLALLAGAGGAVLLDRVRSRRSARAAGAVALALVTLIVIEGRGLPFDPFDNQAQPPTPTAPASVADVPAPQLHLPADRPEDNRRYLLWSTDGFPAIVNGRSSVQPLRTDELIDLARPFPSAESVAALREAGVRSVVLHTDQTEGTAWSATRLRPVGAPGVTRTERARLVIYELGSPPAGSGRSERTPPR